MERSNTYYIIRGIARAVTQLVIAGLIMLGFYALILGAWAVNG